MIIGFTLYCADFISAWCRVGIGCPTGDSTVAGSNPGRAVAGNSLIQVVHTHASM